MLLYAGRTEAEEPPAFQSSIDTGYSRIDKDSYWALLIHQHIEYWGFVLVTSAPLHFRLADNNSQDYRGIRGQDWDEASDFGRIVPKLAFSKELSDGLVAFSFGNVGDYSMGKGTIVAHFSNNIEMDHYHPGAVVMGNWKGNGGSFLIDNVFMPTVIAGRFYISPVAWFSSRKSSEILELGATVASGLTMPFVYHESKQLNILTAGGEIIFHFMKNEKGKLDLYSAAMAMDGDGGFHVGMDVRVNISTSSQNVILGLLGEYRFVGHDYHPAVFNPFYEKLRLDFMRSATNLPLSLADQLSFEEDMPAQHGMMFEVSVDWTDTIQFCARYDREGKTRPHWVLLNLTAKPSPHYQFRLFYSGYDESGSKAPFGYNNLMAFAFRGRLWKPFDILGHFSRRFRRQHQHIRFANEILGGLGFAVRY